MPRSNNVYKPKMAGVLIAAIALLMTVIVIAISAILIMSLTSSDEAPETTTGAVLQPWYTTPAPVTTPAPITTPPVVTQPPPDTGDVPVPGATSVEMLASQAGQGALVLIDKNHFYTREGLVKRTEMNPTTAGILGMVHVGISDYYKIPNTFLYLDADTKIAFDRMAAALMDVTGNRNLQIRNAYYYSPDLTAITTQDAQETVEHSTGCVVDLEINNNGISPLTSNQYKETYYNWLVENCWKYGFIHLRDTNKYSTFRYIGVAHAAALHNESSLSFENYLTSLTAYNFDNRKKVIDSDGNEWWIYYVKAEEGAETVYVTVLGDPAHYQISGDNKQGFIVAINSAQFAK